MFVCRSPKILLEDTKGLSDAQKNELLKELNDLAQAKKGEVIIYDLAQIVEAFLHKHNKAPSGSFYDQMLKERLKRDADLERQQAQKISHEQQILRDEVLKRKEILKNEVKWRRDTRRSMSESSPTHRVSSSSETSCATPGFIRGRIFPSECAMHMSSEDLYFANVGRKIRRGCCLGKMRFDGYSIRERNHQYFL